MNFRPTPVLRGRDAELGAVATALEKVDRGGGHVLLIEGPPGIGKTALLAQAGRMAEQAGARVLFGEAFESQQTVPLAPLLAALCSGAAPVVDADAARRLEETTDARYWVVNDLQSALETAAARSPLVIALDDVHWVDTATVAALRWLAPGLAELPILWLLAARTGRRPRAVAEILTRLPHGAASRLRMGELAPEAVVAVIGDLVHAEADGTLAALADRAQGNPFLLVELLRGMYEEGRLRVVEGRAAVVGGGLPKRLTASTSDRLAALSADAEQILRVAAALPPRFSAAQLAAVLRLPPSSLVAPLEETLEADLLSEAGEQLAFRHDVLRQAVLETMPRSLRRALQRDAVAVLLAAGAAPREVALQLAQSAEPGDRAAVATLREAARRIAGSDAVAAADLSARALDLLPAGDADRGPVTAETVTLLDRARRSGEAEALAHRALAGVLPAEQEAEVRLSLSTMMTRSTVARARENRRALTLPGLTPLIRGRHLAWLAYNLSVAGESAKATPAAESALQQAAITGDRETRVMAGLALACADGIRGAYTRALSRIDDLRRVCQGQHRWLCAAVLAFHRAHTLAVLGRLDEARAMVVDGISAAREERDSFVLAAWTQFGGLVNLSAGRLSDARAEVWSAVPAEAEPVADTLGGTARMVVLSELGAHRGDRGWLRAGRATARMVGAESSPAVRWLAARVLARTASGPGVAADAVRVLAEDPLAPATPLVPSDLGYHPWVAHVARATGATDLAERVAAVAEALDRQNPGVPLLAGLARHTRGLLIDDTAMLVDAARLLAHTQRPLLAAAAAEDAGRVLAERRSPAAVEHLTAAFDAYAAHGATVDAGRIGRLLRRHGVARRASGERPENGWASLTSSELQVARIIAAGATNRSAAEQLYLSPHTVSSHLRSAFTKLGINSRVQLARVLPETEP